MCCIAESNKRFLSRFYSHRQIGHRIAFKKHLLSFRLHFPTTCTHTQTDRNSRVIHTKPITLTHAYTHTGQIIPFAQLCC